MSAAYEVVRQIGEGGMGRVYEAVHHPSGRVVAVKTLRWEHASSQRLLLNEAAAAAQLTHPRIVELLDVGRDEHGAMFLVMELVRGASLEAWSSAFPGVRALLAAFDEILDALATAHAQGIVHGDLKPANVLGTPDGHVKLTDFGVAHVIDPLKRDDRRGVQGTPYYMAPEQLLDPSAIGPSTDLYAVGVMLYELLSLEQPYARDGMIAVHKMGPPRPLVVRPGLEVAPAMIDLVMTLLEPNPRTRPRFAARVRRALAEAGRDARSAGDDRARVAFEQNATWVDGAMAHAPTEASGTLPPSPTTDGLPFTLPCAAGASPEISLQMLRPVPLVGRDPLIARLLGAANEVITGAGPRAVLLSGRAGDGKTRLVRQGFADVERAGTMLGAAASFDETIANPQVGLRACMARLVGVPLPTLEATLRGPWKWLSAVAQSVDLARMHEWLEREDRPVESKVAANIAADCVLVASRVYPVYLWLDDVAWSRDGAMELVTRLLERADARVVVLGTLRSGTAEHPAVGAWLEAATRLGAIHEVVSPLDEAGRAALVSAVAAMPANVAEEIAHALDEPTLVIVETVRAWIEAGQLVPSESGYALREGASAEDLASRASESVLAERIATLLDGFGDERDAAERVLGHAALLGLRFEDRALRKCTDASAIDRVLDRALLTGLLRVDGHGAYRFEHRLFLDAIVERVSKRADSAAIHATTAEALDKTYGKRSIESALVAAHLYRAGRNPEAAARHAADAARSRARASQYGGARDVLALLTSWNEHDALPKTHLHYGLLESALGQLAYYELDYPKAREHFERSCAIFVACASKADEHDALFHISSAYFYEDDFGQAEHHIQFVNEPVADPLGHARAHHRLAEIAALRGELDSAIEHEREAVRLCAERDAFFEFVASVSLVDLQIAAGKLEDATSSTDYAAALAEQISDKFLRSEIEHTLAALDAAYGRFEPALARSRERRDSLVARGDKWQATSARALVMLCTAALDRAEVEATVEEFVAAYAAIPHDEALTWWTIRTAVDELRAHEHPALADRVAEVWGARVTSITRALHR